MSKTFEQDYKFGIENENKIIVDLNLYFKDVISKTDKFCKYDFESNKAIYELKSRNNNYKTFDTTLIPFDKILKTTKIQYFIFSFFDGLYYIKYEKDLFDCFDLMPFQRHQRSDYVDMKKLYYYIPVWMLNKIK